MSHSPNADHRGPRRLTVLQFAYGSSLYGAERWVLALIKNLDPRSVETIVGCIVDSDSPDLPLLDEARRLGFRTVVLDGRRRRIRQPVQELRRAIRDLHIDVVHSHGTRQDLVALLARQAQPCRVVSTPHGWAQGVSPRAWLYDTLDRALLPFCDAVAPLSPSLHDSVRWLPIPGRRLRLIPNAVDLDEIDRASPFPNGLPVNAPPGAPIIGFMGQLIPRKGVDVLLRALALIRDKQWHCLILGDGPIRSRLEQLAASLEIDNRVSFLGFQADRLSYLKHFDLFVLPSHREGISRSLMEALAAGVPCIGSRIPGIQELVEDSVTGMTFPAGNWHALAQTLAVSLVDMAGLRPLADAGRARVLEAHHPARMARAYESVYSELCHVR